MTLSGDLSTCVLCREGEPLYCVKCACRVHGDEDPIEGLDVSQDIKDCLRAIKNEVDEGYRESIDALEAELKELKAAAQVCLDQRERALQKLSTTRKRLSRVEEGAVRLHSIFDEHLKHLREYTPGDKLTINATETARDGLRAHVLYEMWDEKERKP